MNPDDWREPLEPPRGGLARLQERIESPAPAWRWPWPLAAAAASLAFAAALVMVPQWLRRERWRAALAHALTPPSSVSVERGAALELPSGRADVRIVFVAALSPAAPTSAAPPR